MPGFEADGAFIDYKESGSGASLVLVHGSWVDRSNWALVQPGFERSFRTVSYSRRGHGESTGGGGLDDDVRDLAALIEHLELAPVHLVGNSLGATICLRLASSRPELVASLSAHEPPLFGLLADDPQWQAGLEEGNRRVGAVLELIAQGDNAQAAERFADDVALGPGTWATFPPEARDTFIRHAATFAEENTDPSISVIDPRLLTSVTLPVLLSGGGVSPPLFAPTLDRLESLLGRTERHLFPEAGHVPHLTQPHEHVKAVSEFVSGTSRVTNSSGPNA